MRQETNNEIDLLLRRLSRRQGPATSDAGSRIDSDHLDADELSSYAENVLPAAARARYTEHLAECSRCRELVVQLSASVPAAKETLTAAGPSGLRKFLASLFAPMVLRYAVPALGLIVVTAIGILVLRSEQPGSSVAQLDRARETQPTPVPNAQPQSGAGFLDKQARTEPQSQATTSEANAARTKETAPAPASNTDAAATEAKAEPTTAPVQRPEAQPSATPAPPPQAPKPAETVDEMRVEAEGRKPQAAPGSGVAPAGGLARQKSAEDLRVVTQAEKKSEDAAAARRPARARSDSSAQTSGETSNYRVAEQEKDRDDGVIRIVAGRRFRKQGGVWVDTAYNSGSAITNVSRGSEQYRALVADEPTIKTIADQLDGAIIVVWKGRTYRIR